MLVLHFYSKIIKIIGCLTDICLLFANNVKQWSGIQMSRLKLLGYLFCVMYAVKKNFENDENGTRCKEQAIQDLGQLYAKHEKAAELAELIKFSRSFLGMISKAKAAKLVKALVDLFLDMEAGTGSEVSDFL